MTTYGRSKSDADWLRNIFLDAPEMNERLSQIADRLDKHDEAIPEAAPSDLKAKLAAIHAFAREMLGVPPERPYDHVLRRSFPHLIVTIFVHEAESKMLDLVEASGGTRIIKEDKHHEHAQLKTESAELYYFRNTPWKTQPKEEEP